jgi:hypothetical protein
MYHPASDGDAEYLELLNTTSDHLLLDGVYFDAGIQFVFPIGTVLAPGDRLLLVADRDAFTAAYGEHLQIAGEFAENTRLSNSGELLKLVASDGLTELDSVDYSDAGVWPSAADGSGYSLTRRDPPQQGHSSWRLSVLPDGSPGTSDSTIFDGDPLADADNNSVPDLIDYALGPAPHLNSSIDRSGELPLQRLSFRRNLAADDVHLALEVSADAEQWSPAGDEWLFFPGDPLGDGTALDRFERSSPGPEPTILVRLKAAFRP